MFEQCWRENRFTDQNDLVISKIKMYVINVVFKRLNTLTPEHSRTLLLKKYQASYSLLKFAEVFFYRNAFKFFV